MDIFKDYFTEIQNIRSCGKHKEDRTGTGTVSRTGISMRFNVPQGKIPLLGHKFTSIDIVKKELAWMLSGQTNVNFLKDEGVKIWNKWADEDGSLGRIYGFQWRHGFGKDQIDIAINRGAETPYSRRNIVTAWNPSDTGLMALPPCHHTFQFVFNGSSFDIVMTQRSGDMFLGLPYNISFYSLLGRIYNVAILGRDLPFDLVINVSDAHIYVNHMKQTEELLMRYAEVCDVEDTIDVELLKHNEIGAEYAKKIMLSTEFYKTLYLLDNLFHFDKNSYTHLGVIKAPVAV